MMMYYPIFLQGVQGISVMNSGQILTPFSVVMAFMSVPAGFILAKTKRYKWMYITGYALVTMVLFGIVLFDSHTSVFVCVLTATLAGLGLGTIPTINTIVVQLAVPRDCSGIHGRHVFQHYHGNGYRARNPRPGYERSICEQTRGHIPAGLKRIADKEALAALGDPKALLSPAAMKALEISFEKMGTNGKRCSVKPWGHPQFIGGGRESRLHSWRCHDADFLFAHPHGSGNIDRCGNRG